MSEGGVSAWGFASDTIQIFSFLGGLFHSTPNPNQCNIRVYAALNGNGLSDADGSISNIELFNEFNQLIGNGAGGYVGSGGFKDMSIGQENNQQATYAQLFASNDAVCTPVVTATWVDGSQYAWVGDWGWYCGLEWYWGNVFVNGNEMPRCTWVDGDHSNGISATSIEIGWTSYASTSTSQPGCGNPAFRAFNGGSEFIKRTSKLRQATDESRLVVSPHHRHNATELCQSETSWGPDFVSLSEGLHCDMATRELTPICGDKPTADCFDVNGAQTKKRALKGKKYSKVIRW